MRRLKTSTPRTARAERSLPLLALLLLCALLCACGEDPNRVTAHFILPDEEFTLDGRIGEPLELPTPDPLDGYTFLGWRNEAGEMEQGDAVVLEEDAYFAAEYGIGFLREEHMPYLFADELGLYRPNEPLTRGDAARMLCALMGVKVEGTSNFYDVSPKAEYAEAVSSIKELGLVTDRLFRPKAPITYGDLYLWLAYFAPEAKEKAVFEDLDETSPYYEACCALAGQGWIAEGEDSAVRADRSPSRVAAAELMNRVLGREAHPEELELDYSGFYDMPRTRSRFLQMLEAVTEHEYKRVGGKELWTSAEVPKPLIEGFTTGDREIDLLIRDILDSQLTEGMTLEEQLRALYDYIRDNCKYRQGKYYDMGDTSWLTAEAKKMLRDKRGNCYSFAAALCELYRAIGVDARVYSGYIVGSPHGWVEADIDGVTYIFDVEMEYASLYRPKPGHEGEFHDMFMHTREQMRNWRYVRGDE